MASKELKKLPPPTSKELQAKVIASDKSAAHFLKISIAVAVIFIISSLSYLVWQNVQSNNRIQQIQKNLTSVVEKQTEELNQIKANQVSNIANNHTQFTAIENLLQQQNDYIKCVSVRSDCVEPTFTSQPTSGTNTNNQSTQPAQKSSQPTNSSPSPTPTPTPVPTPAPNLWHKVLNFFGL